MTFLLSGSPLSRKRFAAYTGTHFYTRYDCLGFLLAGHGNDLRRSLSRTSLQHSIAVPPRRMSGIADIAHDFGINPPGFVARVVAFAFGLAAASFFSALIMGIYSRRMNREGTVGMLLNFATALLASRYTPKPPRSVVEMVERIRIPAVPARLTSSRSDFQDIVQANGGCASVARKSQYNICFHAIWLWLCSRLDIPYWYIY